MFGLAGGSVGGLIVSVVESRGIVAAAPSPESFYRVASIEVGVIHPVALAIAAIVVIMSLLWEPSRPHSLDEHFAAIRAEQLFVRVRYAALAPLVVLAAFAWSVAVSHSAVALAGGSPRVVGLELALVASAYLFAAFVVVATLFGPLRRMLARLGASSPRAVDPVTTTGVAAVVALLLLAVGIWKGEPSGENSEILGIFGVLKRPEVDLRPFVNIAVIAVGAYLAPIVCMHRPRRHGGSRRLISSIALVILPAISTITDDRALDRYPEVAESIEQFAPLGRIALRIFRRTVDVNEHEPVDGDAS